MIPQPTSSAERPPFGDWTRWSPADPPNVHELAMWSDFDPFWLEDASGWPVDEARTLDLARFDKEIRTGAGARTVDGVRPGVPFHRLDLEPTEPTEVWHARRPPVPLRQTRFLLWTITTAWDLWPAELVPLPAVVRRYGDPTVTGTDAAAFLVDPDAGVYYELSGFGPATPPCERPWRATNVSAWRLDRDWTTQRAGVTAAKIPLLPQLYTYEALEADDVPCGQLVLSGYRSRDFVAPARGTDGNVAGHPVMAGDRLVLRPDSAAALLGPNPTRHDRALVRGWLTRGAVCADKTSMDVRHSFRFAMDDRLKITVVPRLTDFMLVRRPGA